MNYRAQISKDNLKGGGVVTFTSYCIYYIYEMSLIFFIFFAKITFHTIFCRDGDSLDQEQTKYSLMK